MFPYVSLTHPSRGGACRLPQEEPVAGFLVDLRLDVWAGSRNKACVGPAPLQIVFQGPKNHAQSIRVVKEMGNKSKAPIPPFLPIPSLTHQFPITQTSPTHVG